MKNDQSTARDHLANERTFLAWIRTGLAVVGLGLLVEKAFTAPDALRWAAGLLLAFGAALIGYGTLRYEQVRRELRDGHFVIARVGVLVIGGLALLLTLLIGLWRGLS